MNKLASIIVCSAAAIAIAAPAVAASADYYLIIDGVAGEASSAARVSNWSLGASNPTSVGQSGMSAGKTGKPAVNHEVASPRDTASGLATGRVAAGDVNGDGMLDFSEAGRLDETGPLSLTLPAGSDAAKELCGQTTHLRSGHIVSSDGAVYDLSSVKAVCSGNDGRTVTVSLTGSMKVKNYVGHVTLIKQ